MSREGEEREERACGEEWRAWQDSNLRPHGLGGRRSIQLSYTRVFFFNELQASSTWGNFVRGTFAIAFAPERLPLCTIWRSQTP